MSTKKDHALDGKFLNAIKHPSKSIRIPSSTYYQAKISRIMAQAMQPYTTVDYVALHVMSPDNTMTVFTSMPHFINALQTIQDIGLFSGYRRSVYQTHVFYTWKECFDDSIGQKVKRIAYDDYHLYNGITLVRKLPQTAYYLLYSMASHQTSPSVQTHFINVVDSLLKLGDTLFNQVHDIITTTLFYPLPQIHHFVSFSTLLKKHIDTHARPLIQPTHHYGLTPSEQTCLRWAGEGKTAEETAVILDRSVETVRIHLRHIRHKMNSSSISGCLVKALRQGWL